MAHDAPLITAIVIGLCLAFIFGAIANRFRISPLVGYVLAGVLVGPNTPGFQADSSLVQQLAEIGVILLMFGVGLHFSLKDLLSVRHIAIPGAIIQMAFSTCLGLLFAWSQGWGTTGGLVFGLALSAASTVVLLRALQEKSLLETERGRIAVGWLIVEDMVMVLLLVLLPVLAGKSGSAAAGSDHLTSWLHFGKGFGTGGLIAVILAKLMVFMAVMMLVGRRLIPKILKMAAQTGSRELFSLSVLAIALGVAFGSAQLFGVSLALGAFFAGMIMSESDLSQRAAEETLPLRDAFAVLFFVSVGMLFQPGKIMQEIVPLLAVLAIILIGNSLAAFCLMRLFRQPAETALTVAASLTQIGEFSFILASFGNAAGLLNNEARDCIIGGAIISILLNPLIFAAAEKFSYRLKQAEAGKGAAGSAAPQSLTAGLEDAISPCTQSGHNILVGFAAIGEIVAQHLQAAAQPVLVIENNPRLVEKARSAGFETIMGNAARDMILELANIKQAQNLILTIDNAYEAAHIAALARQHKDSLAIMACADTEEGKQQLTESGVAAVIITGREIAAALLSLLSARRTIITAPAAAAGEPEAPPPARPAAPAPPAL